MVAALTAYATVSCASRKEQALLRQVVGQVGGGGVALNERGLSIGIDGDAAFFLPVAGFTWPPTISAKMRSVSFERVHGVEQRLLVFLVVLVVGQGWPSSGDQAHQVADHAAGLAARQFGHVRVLLLRHDRAARGEAVGDLDEAKFWLIQMMSSSQAAHAPCAQAGGGGEFDGEIAVAHGVQAVLANALHAQRLRHASRSSG